MKRVLLGIGVVALVVAASATLMGPAQASNGAYISRGFDCGVFDGAGNLAIVNGRISVSTYGGSTTLVCGGSGVANPTGGTVIKSGFLCSTGYGPTSNTRNVVTASGNVTLTCRL